MSQCFPVYFSINMFTTKSLDELVYAAVRDLDPGPFESRHLILQGLSADLRYVDARLERLHASKQFIRDVTELKVLEGIVQTEQPSWRKQLS